MLHPEDDGSMSLQKGDILLEHYNVSQPRRPRHGYLKSRIRISSFSWTL